MKLEVVVPAIGESITEATMGSWLKDEGAYVEEDDVLCEIESEKATVEITAEKSGKLHQKAAEGDTINIGAIIAEIETSVEQTEEEVPEKETSGSKTLPAEEKEDVAEIEESDTSKVKISPVAANILEQAGIKAQSVKGSGSGGKIVKSDALKALSGEKPDGNGQQVSTAETPQSEEGVAAASPADFGPLYRNEKRVRMTTLRKTIARRLLEAKHGTAMLTTFNEIDMSNIKAVRAQYKDIFKEKHGIGLGFMSFFTKACCIALQEIPGVNAMIDDDDLVYHDFCDIGIAVSTDKGLVVPVVRNADKMGLAEIEKEIARLAELSRNGKLSIDEMSGGTFSITNGGVFGSLMATPIINAPQSAILGMHAIKDRAVVVDREIVIRPMMYVALSYDHRVIDGKESVTFLKRVKELVEDPVRMILDA